MKRYESWFDRAKSSYNLSKKTVYDVYYEDLCYQMYKSR
jgi:hypothetical protein